MKKFCIIAIAVLLAGGGAVAVTAAKQETVKQSKNEKRKVRCTSSTVPVSPVAAKKAKATTVAPVAKEPDKFEIDRIQRGENVGFLLSHPEQ